MTHEICPVKARIEKLLASPDCPDPNAKLVKGKKVDRDSSGRPFFSVSKLLCPTTSIVTGTKVAVSRPKDWREYLIPTSEEERMTPYMAAGLIGVLGG